MKRKKSLKLLSFLLLFAMMFSTCFGNWTGVEAAGKGDGSDYLNAAVLTLGKEAEHSFGSGEKGMVYEFTISKSSEVVFNLTGTASATLYLVASTSSKKVSGLTSRWDYATDGNDIYFDTKGSVPTINEKLYLTAGKYYILVGNKSTRANTTKLKITVKEIQETVAESLTNVRDTIAKAGTIAMNTKVTGVFGLTDEYDYYKFVIQKKGKLTIDASVWATKKSNSSYAKYSLSFYILDSNHQEVGSVINPAYKMDTEGGMLCQSVNVSSEVLTPGTYYLAVEKDKKSFSSATTWCTSAKYEFTLKKADENVKVTSITLSKTTQTLKLGSTGSFTLTATVAPSGASNKAVSWETSNTSVAYVSSTGVVTAVGAGTTTITCRAKDGSGVKATCAVTVQPAQNVLITGIKLSKTTDFIYLDGAVSHTLTATITPSSATNKELTWKSSNTKIATVTQKGVVKGIAPGKVTISATAKDGSGKKAVCTVTVVAPASLSYQTQIQRIGWQSSVEAGAVSGTSGQSLRLEGIKIKLLDNPYAGGIEYSTHVQRIGWQKFVSNGALSGTVGQSLRLEAIKIRLTGKMADNYDVYYRVHSQQFGWLGWAKNGEMAGTSGYSYRLEAIQIVLVRKGQPAPALNLYGIRSLITTPSKSK